MARGRRRFGAAALAAACCVGLSGCQEPAVPDSRQVHFTAAGDIGLGSGARAVLDTVAGLEPDFNISLGDFSYKAGAEQDFCNMVTGRLGPEFPYQLVTGNHESDGSDGDISRFAECLPNKLSGLQGEYGTQWYVDIPQEKPLVRIILISPGLEFKDGKELDYSRGSRNYAWTEEAIDGARNSNIPWTLVAMHTPCFSLGQYGCVAGQALTNLLVSKKVDLVMTAHEHAYQRTHQLVVNGACPWIFPGNTVASCIANSANQVEQGKGTVFAGAGTGGAGEHDLHGDDPEAGYFATWSGANKNPALGTLDVTVTDRRLDARFVPAAGYSFTDSFSISR
jgi:hypothetical protein